jgi:hypothetical protein
MPGIGIGIGIGFHHPPPPKVKFDLLENGLDFVNEALQAINATSNNRRLKYSIIHLCSGIELIFKEILIKKDWKLIFNEPAEAKEELLQTGNFDSVTFNQAISRLENKCKVSISQDDKKILSELRKKRNRIEHFKIDETVSAIKSMCSDVLNFLIPFIDQNIDITKVSHISKRYIDNLPTELSKFSAYVTKRNQRIKLFSEHKLAKGITVIKCPRCFQKELFIDEHLKCLFCNFTSSPESIVMEYNKAFESNNTISKNCEVCNSPTIIHTDGKTVCISCWKIFATSVASEVKP